MAKQKFLDRVKERYGIQSNFQIFVICLVFALTGLSAVEVRKVIFPLVGVTDLTPIWLKSIFWLFLIFPSYYIFLLTYGFIFGQKRFFWNMFKKSVGRFYKPFKKKSVSESPMIH
ncbi:MAG TPA: DUF6787 family protein [Cytophagaceae bacterium]|jgi:hypothetical protein